MRAPAQLIPTGNLRISVATGALVTLGLLVMATRCSAAIYSQAVMMSPFISGAIAGLVYGGVGTKGGGHFVVIGYLSFALLIVLLFLSVAVLGASFFRIEYGLAWVVGYILAVCPLLLMVPIIVSIVGTMFGWLVALAIRR